MFFYKVCMYKTQIESKQQYLKIIIQGRQYLCKYYHAKINGFFWGAGGKSGSGTKSETLTLVPSLCSTGSFLALLSEFSLGFILCTEQKF